MINSILKAIDITNLFNPQEPRLSLAQISQRLDLPKSTAHNLLNTLLSRGWVEKVDSDHYALGTALLALTQGVRVNVEVRDRAAPLLRELANATGESVYLTVLDGDYCLYIYGIESSRRLLARTAVGDRVLMHYTSVGKAILAWLPKEQVDGIARRAGLPAATEASITKLAALHKELELTRARGYATDCEEHEEGTFCVGAPIFDQHGRVLGSCSVSGIDSEMVQGRLPELSARVTHTAQEISRRMGYVPATLALVAAPPGSNP